MKRLSKKSKCYAPRWPSRATQYSIEFIHIEASLKQNDWLMELHAKTILSELPNGHLYRVAAYGRILKKYNSRDRRPDLGSNTAVDYDPSE